MTTLASSARKAPGDAWSSAFQRYASGSSPASTESAMARPFGLWNCDQSLAFQTARIYFLSALKTSSGSFIPVSLQKNLLSVVRQIVTGRAGVVRRWQPDG